MTFRRAFLDGFAIPARFGRDTEAKDMNTVRRFAVRQLSAMRQFATRQWIAVRQHRQHLWLLLLAVAVWPQLGWMARRLLLDGSDDPLGLAALAALFVLGLCHRRQLRAAPDARWLVAAFGLALAASLGGRFLPPLLAALPAVLALAAGLRAVLPSRVAALPMLGLAVLALPVMASLQFYAGYPLRLLVAEMSRWTLGLAFEVEREGVLLRINGQAVLVDAACSGVQLVWMGYFTACATALMSRRGNASFCARLPAVGLVILLGNVTRNTLLAATQADGVSLPDWAHQGIGLIVLAAVCAIIASIMMWRQRTAIEVADELVAGEEEARPSAPFPCPPRPQIAVRQRRRVAAFVGLSFIVCLFSAFLPAASAPTIVSDIAPEWPAVWRGAPLRPLALSAVEHRFARGFPGHIARLTNEREVLIWRHVTRPTRMMHPAADCYRAAGWRIAEERLEQDSAGRWRCFTARSGRGEALRVCEQITDTAGQTYTDASAWYWSALLGETIGPWQALTVASPL
jgi:exosortase/archaeosortase family protein